MASKDQRASFSATELNHVALRVSDMEASVAFYHEVFGAVVVSQSTNATFLQLPNDDFIALFPADIPHIEHFCLTVPGYEPDATARRLEAAGHRVVRNEDRVFVRDPDGLLVQLSGPNRRE